MSAEVPHALSETQVLWGVPRRTTGTQMPTGAWGSGQLGRTLKTGRGWQRGKHRAGVRPTITKHFGETQTLTNTANIRRAPKGGGRKAD